MATHEVPWFTPYPLEYAYRVRNGTPVQAITYTQIARHTNHITAYHKKWLARFANSVVPAGAAGTLTSWRAYIRTGHHVKGINVDVVLRRPDNAAATDPYVIAKLLNTSTGAVIASSTEYHYGPIDTGASGGPGETSMATLAFDSADFADDTAYWLQIYAEDYAKIVSASAYELGTTDGTVDDSITGAVNPNFAVGGPVTDAQRLAIAAAQTEIIKTNRQCVFSWGVYDDSSHNHTGTTATNMLDLSSTSVSAASPGFYLNNLYKNTVSRSAVPVLFAVYAASSGVAGTKSAVRLTDGSNTITIDSITSEGWYTQTGTITAAAATKLDIHGYSDNAVRVCNLWAATLIEYE